MFVVHNLFTSRSHALFVTYFLLQQLILVKQLLKYNDEDATPIKRAFLQLLEDDVSSWGKARNIFQEYT